MLPLIFKVPSIDTTPVLLLVLNVTKSVEPFAFVILIAEVASTFGFIILRAIESTETLLDEVRASCLLLNSE